MTSRKREKGESFIGRDADAGSASADASRARAREEIREKLESGELIIEFEMEEPEETRH
jgi:hypothetical protein